MYIDIICVLLVAYGFYVGFTNGIIDTIFKYLSIVIGVLVALNASKPITDILKSITGEKSEMMNFIGIGVTFIVAMFLIRLFANGLEGIIDAAGVNIVNRLFGGVLIGGALIFMYSWILWFMDSARLLSEQEKNNSTSYVILEDVPDFSKELWGSSRPAITEFWNHLMDASESLREAVQEEETQEVKDY